MARGNRPRDVAIRVLARVLSDGETLDQALAQVSGEVNPSDRGWLQDVCSGALRWKGRLDQAIDAGALKKKPSGWLRRALLVGAYQLVAQERTVPAVVVSESVDEVKRKEGESPAKFVNASLRKIADHAIEWRELPFPPGIREQALWASMPEFLWRILLADQGAQWARGFAEASLRRPEIWVRARFDDWRPEWAEPGPVPKSWKAKEGGSIPEKAGFREGDFIVQDISSQALVFEISQRVIEAGGKAALDLCAAPGGKAVGMAWEGLAVTASDRDATRLKLLQQTLDRAAQTSVAIIERTSVAGLPEQDLVWVDAPCTGTGILRRHPDVKWLRKETDRDALLPIQRDLIREGWSKVKRGGYLAYSVCSVLKQEGPGHLDFLVGELGAERVQEWAFSPHHSPFGDGFWAVLVKKS